MKNKVFLWIGLGIAVFVLLTLLLTKVVLEPWIGSKIQTSVNEISDDYACKIERVHVSIFRSGFELREISLLSKKENGGKPNLIGEIETVTFQGIHLIKAILRQDVDIREVDIFNARIIGKFAFPKKSGLSRVSPLNIRIDYFSFDKLVIDVKSTTTAQSYSVTEGALGVYDICVRKEDTLSPDIFDKFDFEALEFSTVTCDSLYTFSGGGISYSAFLNTLAADSFVIQPNYSENGFTAQHQYQADRIEGRFRQIFVHDFSASDYLKSRNLTSSLIEIGNLNLNVFRDRRKEFRHIRKPTFQEMIYGYPGALNIDSIKILSGGIVYSEYAKNAIEKGSVRFSEIDVLISKITNSEIYKTEKAYLEMKVNALLMDKAQVAILLKSRIFDKHNTFAVNGTLSEMEARGLNSILESGAFVTINSGKINAMDFSFSANNTKASGSLRLLYQGLNFAVVDNLNEDTKAIIGHFNSIFANIVVLESNPVPGKEARSGIIENERDPEKFLINYVFKSIMSGIETSITRIEIP